METEDRLPAQENIQPQHINTEGGTAITGTVDTGGGDFVGRDKVTQQSVDASINIAIGTEGSTISNSLVTIGNVSTNVYQNVRPTPLDKATLDAALDTLSRLPLNSIPPIAVLPMGSRIPYSVNPLFVGREKELLTLAAHLKGGETIAIGQIAAATGLGGIGKTQLAAAFVHHYGQFFAGGVHWLSFAEPKSVPAEIVACGMMMPDLRADYATLDFETQVHLVLAAWQSPLPRLLVFDNCEDPNLLAQWKPPTGGNRVLLTSRRASWERALGVSVLALETLPRAQSIELLRKFRPELAASDTNLEQIAAELGDLPLALHLAGSFLARYRHSTQPAEYLAQLRQLTLLNHRSLQLSDHSPQSDALSPTQHIQHVGRTFALSYEQLSGKDPVDKLAQRLLAHIPCFAPGETIVRALLLKTIERDDEVEEWQLEDGIQRLADLGLLEEAAAGALRLHRLVARFIQQVDAEAMPQAQYAVEGALLAEANRINDSGLPGALLIWQGHLRHVTDNSLLRSDEQAAALCSAFGYHLKSIADYLSAKPYYERALAIRESVLGTEHPHTANSLNNLGELLHTQGDYAGARSYHERALTIYEEVLGAKHPNTATSLDNLGYLLKTQGDYAAARSYNERALAIYEEVLGAKHPDTATSLNNLGALLKEHGDYAAARSYYERALAIREEVLGAKHPHTAQSLNNLGQLLKEQGDYVATRPYYARALAIYEEVLGAKHPNTAISLNNLGVLLRVQGDYAAARPYLERALAIREEVLGAKHPNTANSLNNMGDLLRAQGDYAAARPYYEQALAILEQSFGSRHSYTQKVRNNLTSLVEVKA